MYGKPDGYKDRRQKSLYRSSIQNIDPLNIRKTVFASLAPEYLQRQSCVEEVCPSNISDHGNLVRHVWLPW